MDLRNPKWMYLKAGLLVLTGILCFMLVLLDQRQWALNAIWTPLFFGMQRPGLAFAEILVLDVAVLTTLITFWRVKRMAGALLVPYALWAGFATVLNYTIWQFINWYFHHFTGGNPFGFSSTNLGSLYKGLVKDTFQNFKHLRVTPHTHNPVDDARGNAEALLSMIQQHGLRISL